MKGAPRARPSRWSSTGRCLTDDDHDGRGRTPGAMKSTTTTTDAAGTADTSQLPPGGETKEYTLTRKNIEIPVTETEIVRGRGQEGGPHRLLHLLPGLGRRSRSAVKQAMEVDQVDAIILDLRSNGGGLLDQAVDVASIFIPEGEIIVSTEGLHSPKQVYEATGGAYPEVPRLRADRPVHRQRVGDRGRRPAGLRAGPPWWARPRSERAWCRASSRCPTGARSRRPPPCTSRRRAGTSTRRASSPTWLAPDDPATTGVDESCGGRASGSSRGASALDRGRPPRRPRRSRRPARHPSAARLSLSGMSGFRPRFFVRPPQSHAALRRDRARRDHCADSRRRGFAPRSAGAAAAAGR